MLQHTRRSLAAVALLAGAALSYTVPPPPPNRRAASTVRRIATMPAPPAVDLDRPSPPLPPPLVVDDAASTTEKPQSSQGSQGDLSKDLLPPLAPEDAWIAKVDFDAFGKEVRDLGNELKKEMGDEDVAHLEKISSWRNLCAFVGLATVWMDANPLTILALSQWTYASWTVIGHHVGHGSYNLLDPGRFHSRDFGKGLLNRFVDWLDWIQAETWNFEHNTLHHFSLNEDKDPHVVQRNLSWLRDGDWPLYVKYAMVTAFMMNWKWFYYAPNAYKELAIHEWVKSGKQLPEGLDPHEQCSLYHLFDPTQRPLQQVVTPFDVFVKVLGPMFLGRYVLLPAMLLAVPDAGPDLAMHAAINLLLAELLTNAHSFVTMVTNHAGEDLYQFDDAVKPKTGSYYVRQVAGSVNYSNGNDVLDFCHGWLNYHVEHHVWPSLSMLQVQRGAPRLREICEKHGVPYLQGNIFSRTKKTMDVMVGNASMRRFPSEYEPKKDKYGNAGGATRRKPSKGE